MKSMPNRTMIEAEAGGSFGQEGEPSKVSHAYGYTPTTPVENKRTLYDIYSEMLALLEEEEPGVIHKITITKSATPETETPCRCGVVPLPDEAYPFFNPHDLQSATAEKGSPRVSILQSLNHIFGVSRQADGTFLVMEHCDYYHTRGLTAEELKTLGEELMALAESE